MLQAISRQLILKNFQCALDYIAAVGAVAEEAGHHPDLHLTSYRTVTVKLSTHARGGITSAAQRNPSKVAVHSVVASLTVRVGAGRTI